MKTIILVTSVLAAATTSTSAGRNPVGRHGQFELLILHNNDMHGRFEQTSQISGVCTSSAANEGKCYGGFARIAYVVKEARRAAAEGRGPPVLYLNAGDTYTGTAWFTLYKWKIAAEFINALQPDAVSLGNHEFDNGVSGLIPFIENITCPVLATNLILTEEPDLQSQPNLMDSIIFNISGIQVGVIGYLTPDTKTRAIHNNVEYVEEVVAIREEVAKLTQEGVKILIALGHSGLTKDLQIAKEVEGIDLVIGGHTHTFLWNGTSPDVETPEGPYPTMVQQLSGRLVPVVQAYAYTKYLGKLNLVFNSNGEIISFDGKPILLDESVQQDGDVLSIVNRYGDDILKISGEVVGYASVILDGHTCRLKECNMGNLITDAMIHKYASEYKGKGWSDAPIAIIQGGGIRASVAHGNLPSEVTVGDLMTVLPFDNNVVIVTVNGTIILNMLEHAVENYSLTQAKGNFLQFSGLIVEYDFCNNPGTRVVKAYVRCGNCDIPTYSPVNETLTYNILMSVFLSLGGNEFAMFRGLPSAPLSYSEFQCTIEYVQSRSPVYPAIENRIVLHNIDELKVRSEFSIIRMIFHQDNCSKAYL